ncbi:MAG: Holliday junction resolvase RuvX [Vicinamibacterales bacterium]|nr:Holliday junction resolvase RuvX [Vicinamibacterales bacterium]
MRTLAIDFGERRIGIAVSDPSGVLARPLEAVAGSRHLEQAAATVLRAIRAFEAADEPVATVVVGLPKRLDGSPNDQTPRAAAFAAILARQSGKAVVLQDERLTSHEADQLLAVRERDWRVRKRRLDAAAAAVILQEYLDGQRQAPEAERPASAGAAADVADEGRDG